MKVSWWWRQHNDDDNSTSFIHDFDDRSSQYKYKVLEKVCAKRPTPTLWPTWKCTCRVWSSKCGTRIFQGKLKKNVLCFFKNLFWFLCHKFLLSSGFIHSDLFINSLMNDTQSQDSIFLGCFLSPSLSPALQIIADAFVLRGKVQNKFQLLFFSKIAIQNPSSHN